MAELNPNVILQTKPVEMPNPLDSAVKALTMKNLMQEHQAGQIKLDEAQREATDRQTLRDAFKNNTQSDPAGNPIVNRQGVMSDLMKANPILAQKQSLEFKQMDLDNLNRQHQIAKSILFDIQPGDQASLDRAKAMAQQYGLPPLDNVLPQSANDPNFGTALRNAQMKSLTAEEQIAQMNKQQEIQNKKTELEIERYKSFGGAPPGMGGGSAPAPGSPAAAGTKKGSPQSKISSQDPAELVRFKVPPAQQPKAFDEVEAAQNTAQNAPKILKAFDDAAGKLHGVDFVPGMESADQKALHALLGPTFKDVEGTVRQAAMDNMNHNVTPQFGDSKKTVDTKRAALVAYLKSKSSAPVAKGFGIDLSNFKSTFVPDDVGKASTTSSKAPEGATKTWEGKTYKLIGDHWVAQPSKQAATD